MPRQLRIPRHKHWALPFSPQACGGWWQVEGVLPGQSRVCVHDAPAWHWEMAAAPSLASCATLLSAVVRSGCSQDPAPSGASLCLPARSLPLALGEVWC